jgi:hypothetical protein
LPSGLFLISWVYACINDDLLSFEIADVKSCFIHIVNVLRENVKISYDAVKDGSLGDIGKGPTGCTGYNEPEIMKNTIPL